MLASVRLQRSRDASCSAAVAEDCLPKLQIADRARVELRCDARQEPHAARSTPRRDWSTEYNDLILSVKVVDSFDEAIAHIETYGTHHSDAIVTECYRTAERFLNEVNSAAVYVNASTRLPTAKSLAWRGDRISTQKLHARGPMGLDELTTVKYAIRGEGQIR
jgi:glutamate-5-semialdehyde dehydrogenase